MVREGFTDKLAHGLKPQWWEEGSHEDLEVGILIREKDEYKIPKVWMNSVYLWIKRKLGHWWKLNEGKGTTEWN